MMLVSIVEVVLHFGPTRACEDHFGVTHSVLGVPTSANIGYMSCVMLPSAPNRSTIVATAYIRRLPDTLSP